MSVAAYTDTPAPQVPPIVIDQAADAAGVPVTIMARAVTVALDGGPDHTDPGWNRAAACHDHHDDYFPNRGRAQRIAVARCRTCPVRAECLAAALTNGERWGIWGGTSENARRRLRKVLREAGLLAAVGEDAYITWREYDTDLEPLPRQHLQLAREPWPHQVAAVDAITAELDTGGTCHVAMATATGKTLVGVWAATRLDVEKVLVLVPNLALIAQTAQVWTAEPGWATARTLAVCSDPGERELELTATTDPIDVAEFLAGPGRAIVFGTYASSHVLAAAGVPFDLIIADEAHHLTGHVDKVTAGVLRGDIPARRTLYMTATPKRFTRSRAGVDTVSMDQAGGFGPRVFDFTLSDAIDAHVIADYRVVVAAVERNVFEHVARQLPESIDPHLLAGAIAVVRSMGDYRLSSCLSFHTRIDRARRFSELVGAVAEALPAARPTGAGWAGFVHGNSSVKIRRQILARLADHRTWGVVANARALGEGVDVPTLDAVAVVDPKQSEVDVLQACGRALRRPTNTKIGTIILPVLLADTVDPADPLAGADQRSLDLVAGVLRALRAHDTDLGVRLDHARRSTVRTQQPNPGLTGWMQRNAARSLLQSRVELHVPGGATGRLAGAIALYLVRDATSAWEEGFEHVTTWSAANRGRMPSQTITVPTGDGDYPIGTWCNTQRAKYAKGLLATDRAERLAALPGWRWNEREAQWWERFDALKAYIDQHGTYPKHNNGRWRDEYHGVRVGSFLQTCRSAMTAHDGRWLLQFPDRIAALEALPRWSWNTKDDEWETSFARLERWVALEGHAAPSIGNLVDGQDVGKWVGKQRSRIRATERGEPYSRTGGSQLTPARIARLRALPGWIDDFWDVNAALWEERFVMLERFLAEHGRWPVQSERYEGFNLGAWVSKFRQARDGKRSTVTPERIARLEAIPGWSWNPHDDRFEIMFERVKAYAEHYGTCAVLPNRSDLANWIGTRRAEHAAGRLAPEKVERLAALPGWIWRSPKGVRSPGPELVPA